MRSYLTIYDEGITEVPNGSTKKKRVRKSKPAKEPFKIPDDFIKIPNCSDYLINKNGIVISVRTSNVKTIKALKDSENCHRITIKNDDGKRVKISIEKLVRELFTPSSHSSEVPREETKNKEK